jgi:hypothetical protein
MAGLAIPSHARRDNRVALLALGLIAAGSFAFGMGRQIVPAGPSPFPQTSLTALQRPALIPEATPAPTLQVAEAEPRPARRAAAPDPDDAVPDVSAEIPAPAPSPPPSATEAAGTDTAAVAAEPPPAPDTETPPT